MKAVTVLALLALFALVNTIVAQTTPAPGSTPASPDDHSTPEPTPSPNGGSTPAPVASWDVAQSYCTGVADTDNLYTTLVRYNCGLECDRVFCQCLGGKLENNGCSGATQSATGTIFNCDQVKQCARSRVLCLNNYALEQGSGTVEPTPAPTPVPPTPAPTPVPPTPTPPTPVPPTPQPPTPAPTPAPPTPTPPTPVPPTPQPPTPVPPTPVPTPKPPTPAPTPVPPTPSPTLQPTEAPASADCKRESYRLKWRLERIAAGTMAYSGSYVEMSCKRLLCAPYRTDGSSLLQRYRYCGASVPSTVCKKDEARPASAALQAQIRLTSAKLEALFVRDPVAVQKAIIADLAKSLGVDYTFVDLLNLKLGSLIVDFRVFAQNGLNTKAFETLVESWKTTPPTFAALVAIVGEAIATQVTAVSQTSYEWECRSGCIAGIVIGSFFFVVFLGVLFVVLKKQFGGAAEGTGEKSEPTETSA